MRLADFVGRLAHRPHRPQESSPGLPSRVPLGLRRGDGAPTAPTGHGLIAGSRVEGTPVFSDEGARWGEIHDLSIDKHTGRIMYALVAVTGARELGERFYPVPWSLLRYDRQQRGYVVPVDADLVPGGPGLSAAELEAFGAATRAVRDRSAFDYNPILVMPFI
jgi:sporulation protein YlmC with PRC-barrel domain